MCRSSEFKPNAAGRCRSQLQGPAVPPCPAQACSRRRGLPDMRGLPWDWSRSHGLDAAQQAELITLLMNCVFWLFFFQKILPEWSESRQWCEPNHVKERGRRLAPDKSRTWCLMVTQIAIGKFVNTFTFLFVCLLVFVSPSISLERFCSSSPHVYSWCVHRCQSYL